MYSVLRGLCLANRPATRDYEQHIYSARIKCDSNVFGPLGVEVDVGTHGPVQRPSSKCGDAKRILHRTRRPPSAVRRPPSFVVRC